jgi:hypothetical protein
MIDLLATGRKVSDVERDLTIAEQATMAGAMRSGSTAGWNLG